MKKLSLIALIAMVFTSCETSEGLKYGLLQKVSHKKFPCDYYVIEVSYEGGRMVSNNDKTASYQNTQEISIDTKAYDTLQQHVGEHIVFNYGDNGIKICEPSKFLTSLKIK